MSRGAFFFEAPADGDRGDPSAHAASSLFNF